MSYTHKTVGLTNRQPDANELSAYRNFIRNISHRISNPLQSIQTNLDNVATSAPKRWAAGGSTTAWIHAAEVRRLGR